MMPFYNTYVKKPVNNFYNLIVVNTDAEFSFT